MDKFDVYPGLSVTRGVKFVPRESSPMMGNGIPAQSEEARTSLIDGLGFFMFVSSAVALLVIVSFYLFMAQNPEQPAVNINLEAVRKKLSSLNTFQDAEKREFASIGRSFSYLLPTSFASLRTDPSKTVKLENYFIQVRFIADVIRKATNKPMQPGVLAKIIVNESAKHGYDPLFVSAVIMAESRFDKKAISSSGALGLMQLLPSTAKYIVGKIGNENWRGHRSLLSDEAYNIKLGVSYLKYLEDKFAGNKRNILVAYNWGPGNMNKALKGNAQIPGESKRYTDYILTNYSKWTKQLHQNRVALDSMQRAMVG